MVARSAVVGALACQRDTYLTTLDTHVTICDRAAKQDDGYEVQFADTVLFPEGGGQPWDHGKVIIDDNHSLECRRVLRRKLEALHYLPEEVPPGTPVKLELDFARRFDNAQQHSGQHLLSAVMDALGVPTLGWAMNESEAYVEVSTLPDLDLVEQRCNEHIRENLPITVHETRDVPSTLPADYDASSGVVRVVCIGKLDYNPCCGTHVRSTGELNALAILHTSSVRGTNKRIHFLVGDRCRRRLRHLTDVTRKAGELLTVPAHEIPDKVVALQKSTRGYIKQERALKTELTAMLVEKLEAELAEGDVLVIRPNSDADVLQGLKTHFTKRPAKHVIIGVALNDAETGKAGALVVVGPADQVATVTKQISDNITVKGGGRGGSYQGKFDALPAAKIDWLKSITTVHHQA
ncbi:hypothetical protein PYCC9005_002945 [Savitreella phatthalungensis]